MRGSQRARECEVVMHDERRVNNSFRGGTQWLRRPAGLSDSRVLRSMKQGTDEEGLGRRKGDLSMKRAEKGETGAWSGRGRWLEVVTCSFPGLRPQPVNCFSTLTVNMIQPENQKYTLT